MWRGAHEHRPHLSRCPVCGGYRGFVGVEVATAEMHGNRFDAHWWRLPTLGHGDDSGSGAGAPARCGLSCGGRSAPAHGGVCGGRKRPSTGAALLRMQGGLLDLELGNQFFDPIDRKLVGDPRAYSLISFNPGIDLDALLTHGRAPLAGGSQRGHLWNPTTKPEAFRSSAYFMWGVVVRGTKATRSCARPSLAAGFFYGSHLSRDQVSAGRFALPAWPSLLRCSLQRCGEQTGDDAA
jgi:hypothetical protein